jgi:hypothetical protein
MGAFENLERRELMAADVGTAAHLATASPLTDRTVLVPATTAINLVPELSLASAQRKDLGTVRGVFTRNGTIDFTNRRDDYYFNLDEWGNVNIKLDNLHQDLDVYLYNSANQLIGCSNRSGNKSELIIQGLNAGQYHISVVPYKNSFGTYRLTLGVDTAGETMGTARNAGAFPGAVQTTGWVGPADTNDYFKFTVTRPSQALFTLDRMSADADLYLYDASGRLVASSTRAGANNEQISRSLSTGTYFLRVTPYGSAQTNYHLVINVWGTGPSATSLARPELRTALTAPVDISAPARSAAADARSSVSEQRQAIGQSTASTNSAAPNALVVDALMEQDTVSRASSVSRITGEAVTHVGRDLNTSAVDLALNAWSSGALGNVLDIARI